MGKVAAYGVAGGGKFNEKLLGRDRTGSDGLPDMRVAVNQILGEGDSVVVYWRASGTNSGEGMGFPATGKRIVVPGMTIFRFKQGKISEEWSVFDMSSAMQQAGLCAAAK